MTPSDHKGKIINPIARTERPDFGGRSVAKTVSTLASAIGSILGLYLVCCQALAAEAANSSEWATQPLRRDTNLTYSDISKNGRPQGFYGLIYSEIAECEILLDALNQPQRRDRNKASRISDLFLKSSLSVDWEIVNDRYQPTSSLVTTYLDINGDGQKEWIVKLDSWGGRAIAYGIFGFENCVRMTFRIPKFRYGISADSNRA